MAPVTVGLRRRSAAVADGERLVGRAGFLQQIADKLLVSDGESLALVPASNDSETVSLHGMGGVGKTALALEFCYSQHASVFETIWWVNADTAGSVSRSYSTYGQHFGIKADTADELRVLIDHHVSTQPACLIVYDNVVDKHAFDDLVPAGFNGAVLATSRSSSQWGSENALPVDVLDFGDARDWLLLAAQATSQLGESIDEESQDFRDATWLAGPTAMGGLALALRMATTYLEDTQEGLAEYRRLYQSKTQTLLDNQDVVPSDYAHTVFVTFGVALAKLIRSGATEARALIEISSFYAPDDIPKRLFSREALESDYDDAVNRALLALSRLSLLTIESETFSIHRLVQEVTRHYLQHPNLLPELEILEAQGTGNTIAVLVASADPVDLKGDTIDVSGAMAAVVDVIAASPLQKEIEARQLVAAKPSSLARALTQSPAPKVVILIGHGDRDRGIALHSDHDNENLKWAGPEALKDLFTDSGVELVLLANCHSGPVAEAISNVVPHVFGTSDVTQDQAARDFVTIVLEALLRGHTIQHAYDQAAVTIDLSGADNVFVTLGDASRTLFSH